MKLADGIRRLGFRKWYERELLRGHSHLAILPMCAMGLMDAQAEGDTVAVRCLGCGHTWRMKGP